MKPEPIVEFLEGQAGVDVVAAPAQLADALVGGGVVLVVNRADDLFEQVLEGDQARERAVLVDDQGDLDAAAAEFVKQGGGNDSVSIQAANQRLLQLAVQ